MDILPKIFRCKKADFAALINYGFNSTPQGYVYQRQLSKSHLLLTFTVSSTGQLSAAMTDPVTDEPYVLHLVEAAVGSFIGTVRQEYEAALRAIADSCFVTEIFQSEQTKAIIAYVQQTYQCRLEHLWPETPENAVWRRKDNAKWFGVVLTVPKNKLGYATSTPVEIIDLHAAPEQVAAYITRKHYYPGWHMNKKHWYTIILDNSLPTEEICKRIDESFASVARAVKHPARKQSV